MTGTDPDDLGLRDYLEIIWRRRLLVVACIVALVGVTTLAATVRTPKYRAEATVLGRLALSDRIRLLSSTKVSAPVIERLLANEVVFARSDAVAARVDAAYGRAVPVTVEAGKASDTIVVTAVAASGADAAARANLYAEIFVKARTELINEELSAALAVVEEEQAAIFAQIEGGADAEDFAARLGVLDSESGTYRSAMRQLRISSGPNSASNQVTVAAKPPAHPFEPAWGRNLTIAAVLGLVLGTGSALLLDALDATVHTERQVAAAAGVPAFSTRRGARPARNRLPRPPRHPLPPRTGTGTGAGAGAGDAIVSADPTNAGSGDEPAVLSLEVDTLLASQSGPRTVAVAGTRQDADGASVAVELADDLARLGRKVLLVDTVHRLDGRGSAARLGLAAGTPGLGDALRGGRSGLPLQAERRSGSQRFAVMTPGTRRPEPGELTADGALARLLGRAATQFDVVVVDVDPLLGSGSGAQIAARASVTVLVARSGSTTGRQLEAAALRLRRAGGTPVLTALCPAGERSSLLRRRASTDAGRAGAGSDETSPQRLEMSGAR